MMIIEINAVESSKNKTNSISIKDDKTRVFQENTNTLHIT